MTSDLDTTAPQQPTERSAFPRSSRYDPQWVRENALGENALWQAEALARHLPFKAGMRVLDLGCGKAVSSIFLAREFDVQVWAADSETSAAGNYQRAVGLGCAERVFPLRVDAHNLPFAKHFFDALTAIDSYLYFGTDDRYLAYLVQFLKPGGFIGLIDIAFRREIRSVEDAPEYLRAQYAKFWSSVHSLEWWRQHWQKTDLVDVQYAQFLPESPQILSDYWAKRSPEQEGEPIMRAAHEDSEQLIDLMCLVANKR